MTQEIPTAWPAPDAEAVAALKKAWHKSIRVDASRWAFREAAAVLDSFDAERLCPFDELKRVAIKRQYDGIKEDCERIPSGGAWLRWRLRDGLRREALRRLGARDRMRAARAANPAPAGTPLQRMLDAIIEGRLPEVSALDRAELSALLNVHRWLDGILPPCQLPDVNRVTQAFARKDLLAPMQHLLTDGFADRINELQQLREFLWSEDPGAGPLLLYGVGGSGKSTLLAKFVIDEINHHPDDLIFIHLDLDRPLLDPERPHTLLLEAARQVGAQQPALCKRANRTMEWIRERARRFTTSVEQRYSESAAGELPIKELAVLLSEAIAPDGGRVLWIVDTFEEAQRRGEAVALALFALFQELPRWFSGVRVVVSGRAKATESVPGTHTKPRVAPIFLKGLDEDSAVQLLRTLLAKVQPQPRKVELNDVVAAVGCNPMCLKMAARIIRVKDVRALQDPVTRKALLDELKEERIQCFLFGRIVEYLRDDRAKPLAYPGLIVRRITADVIRHVLAEPCKIDFPNDQGADELITALENELGIVQREQDGGLRYRPELRDELLSDLLNNVDRQLIVEIDRRAVAFYEKESGAVARAEELYHRMRLGQPRDILDARWDADAAEYLKRPMSELPSEAILWLAGKLGRIVDEATRRLANPAEWESQAIRLAENYLAAGNAEQALMVIRERPDRSTGSELFLLEAQALHMIGRIEEGSEVARKGLQGASADRRIDLLLLTAKAIESQGHLKEALDAVKRAHELASGDSSLQGRVIPVLLRLQRKLGVAVAEVTAAPSVNISGGQSAESATVVVGRDIRASTINIGYTSEVMQAIIAAATKPLKRYTDEQQTTIAALKHRLDASEAQLLTFLRIIGEADVAPERTGEKLVEIAKFYKDLRAQVTVSPSDDPAVARLKADVRDALETGDLDRADALLGEAEHAILNRAAFAALRVAEVRAQRGEIALIQLRYLESAGHFAAAAAHMPPRYEDQRLGYLDQEADALCHQGEEFGDNEALHTAIERYGALVALRPRERVPLDWAMTQANLGNALRGLGERESGTARLEEAVEAYRAALAELTRERMPLHWAMTQTNLGNALRGLGERESGTARLEEAVEAYRAALAELTRERVPLQWAKARNDLGTALMRLGEREDDTARLEAAVAAYEESLKVLTLELTPLHWAQTLNNLGTALMRLGKRENDMQRLEAAVAAYEKSLTVITRQQAPIQWAQIQNNLGNVFLMYRRGDTGNNIERAIRCYHNAMNFISRDDSPAQWALLHNNLSIAYRMRVHGDRADNSKRAMYHYAEALNSSAGRFSLDTFSGSSDILMQGEQSLHDSPVFLREVAAEFGSHSPALLSLAVKELGLPVTTSAQRDYIAQALLRLARSNPNLFSSSFEGVVDFSRERETWDISLMKRLVGELRGGGLAEFVLACFRDGEIDLETLKSIAMVYQDEIAQNINYQAEFKKDLDQRERKMVDSKLKGSDFKSLHKAFMEAFDYAGLRRLLCRIELDKSLEDITLKNSMSDIVFELLSIAQMEGWLGDLLRAAQHQNPKNPKLRAAIEAVWRYYRKEI